jgi:nicotinamide riboside kinase
VRKIVITGPESTGKTELTGNLAQYYKCDQVEEYARSYVEKLKRPYNYLDVLHIARIQQREQLSTRYSQGPFVFFDTDLIITKVWFDLVYGECPNWISKAIEKSEIDLYLLCNTDIPWIPDKVRENGGEMRLRLFDIYQKAITSYGYSYKIIGGTGESRLNMALQIINTMFPEAETTIFR